MIHQRIDQQQVDGVSAQVECIQADPGNRPGTVRPVNEKQRGAGTHRSLRFYLGSFFLLVLTAAGSLTVGVVVGLILVTGHGQVLESHLGGIFGEVLAFSETPKEGEAVPILIPPAQSGTRSTE